MALNYAKKTKSKHRLARCGPSEKKKRARSHWICEVGHMAEEGAAKLLFSLVSVAVIKCSDQKEFKEGKG